MVNLPDDIANEIIMYSIPKYPYGNEFFYLVWFQRLGAHPHHSMVQGPCHTMVQGAVPYPVPYPQVGMVQSSVP